MWFFLLRKYSTAEAALEAMWTRNESHRIIIRIQWEVIIKTHQCQTNMFKVNHCMIYILSLLSSFLYFFVVYNSFIILYYFDRFGRHASQGKWIWPKSVACPRSQRQWPASKNHWSKRPKNFFFWALRAAFNYPSWILLSKKHFELNICSEFNCIRKTTHYLNLLEFTWIYLYHLNNFIRKTHHYLNLLKTYLNTYLSRFK